MSAANLPVIEAAFAPLLGAPRWLVWGYRPNKKDPTKRDKVPFIAAGRRSNASSTNPATWRQWASAKAHVDDADIAGPGIMLGRADDGIYLVGIDLDLALATTGEIQPWARLVLDRCQTYAEISPSGVGIKLLGYARALPPCLLAEDSQGKPYHKGTEGTPPGATIPEGAANSGHKSPELGLYAERRYFTLTGLQLAGAPAALADITEAFAELVDMVNGWSTAPSAQQKIPSPPLEPCAPVLDLGDVPEIVARLLEELPELKAASSGAELTKGKDQSGSGLEYSLMIWLAGRGWDDTAIEAALRSYPHGQIRRMDNAGAERRVKGLLREAGKHRDRVARTREAAAWFDDLIYGKDGPHDNVANVCLALTADPVFRDGIRFDELRACPVVASMPWRPSQGWREWTDVDDVALAEWLQLRGLNARPATCAAAVQHFASMRLIHPLRDHLNGRAWDGECRLDSWLTAYLGVAKNNYSQAVGRAWLISAVARVFKPGCKADHALILEGPQGAFKSTACSIIAMSPDWFADEIADLGGKDSAQDLRGKWIIEIGELSALRRSEVERVKAFISRSSDHYRPSYGRRSQDFARQCVFIGTTNADAYLADETGGRRFWPVKVGKVDTDALRRDIGQLWAEAVAAFNAGEAWHLPREIEMQAREQQADRRINDPWEDAIIGWAEAKSGLVTIADALAYAVGLDLDRRDAPHHNRVGRIFKAHGWERVQLRLATSRVWHYRRPVLNEGVSPVSPVAVAPTGDGKASKSAAVTNVTSVTGELETPGAKSAPLGTNAQGAHALDIGARDSAHKFENQPVTPVTLVTSAEPLRNPSPVPTGDRHHTGDSTPAWDNLTHWQQRVGAAGNSRDRKAMVVAEWCAATGGRLTDDGVWHLPLDLDDSYAARELKRIAGGLDLLPKATAACIDVNDARPQRASAA